MSDEALMQALEPEDQLKIQLQEALVGHVAEQEQSMAMARTEATNIEIGSQRATDTIPYGEVLARTRADELSGAMSQQLQSRPSTYNAATNSDSYIVPFGGQVLHASKNVTVHDIDGKRTITMTPTRVIPENFVHQDREVNIARVVADKSQGIASFDVDGEMAKMRGMTDLGQKEVMAQAIYQNLGALATTEQKRIKDIAAQRSGLNDAQAALDKNIALEQAARAMGRIKPGDSTLQVLNARQAFQAALTASNALELDLAKTNPTLQKYNDQREIMKREFAQIDVQQNRQAAQIDKLPFILTDERLTNAKFAIGLTETNSKSLESKVAQAALRDKALVRILDADKKDLPRFLADNDPKVRRYAYNIMAGSERESLKLAPDAKLPDYVMNLEKMILNPESILTPEQLKVINAKTDKTKAENSSLDPAARAEKRQILIANEVVKQVEETQTAKLNRMDLWTFSDPNLKMVVDGLKTSNKEGKVLLQDGIDAYVRADLKKPDGSPLSMDEKIATLTNNLAITVRNQPNSIILPNAETAGNVVSANIKNHAMRSFIRSQMPGFIDNRDYPQNSGLQLLYDGPSFRPSSTGVTQPKNSGAGGGWGGGGGGGDDPDSTKDGHYVNDNLGSKTDWLTGTKPTAPPKSPEEARQWIDQMERARGNRDRRNKDYSSSKNPLRKVSDEEYNQLANRGRTAERWLVNNGFNLNTND